MMNRLLLISVVFLAATSAILFYSNKQLKTELNAANGQITELNNTIKGYENEISKFNAAQERANQTIEKVRTVVRTVKSDCDCYNTALPDDVRRLLNDSK